MAAALVGIDIVGKGEDRLLVAVVILKGYIHHYGILFSLDVDRFAVDRCTVTVQVLNKLDDAALILKLVSFLGPLILDGDLYPGVEERHLPQTL